jgi:hypothetical protein
MITRLANAIFDRFAYTRRQPIGKVGAMPAPFPVKAVANAILEKAFAEKKPVTPLKLQKLLYYAHGYYSAAYGKALIDQPFEAWNRDRLRQAARPVHAFRYPGGSA